MFAFTRQDVGSTLSLIFFKKKGVKAGGNDPRRNSWSSSSPQSLLLHCSGRRIRSDWVQTLVIIWWFWVFRERTVNVFSAVLSWCERLFPITWYVSDSIGCVIWAAVFRSVSWRWFPCYWVCKRSRQTCSGSCLCWTKDMWEFNVSGFLWCFPKIYISDTKIIFVFMGTYLIFISYSGKTGEIHFSVKELHIWRR